MKINIDLSAPAPKQSNALTLEQLARNNQAHKAKAKAYAAKQSSGQNN